MGRSRRRGVEDWGGTETKERPKDDVGHTANLEEVGKVSAWGENGRLRGWTAAAGGGEGYEAEAQARQTRESVGRKRMGGGGGKRRRTCGGRRGVERRYRT